MAKTITLIRGTTNTVNVAVTDAGGNPYFLKTGELLKFGVKENPGDEEYLIYKEVKAGTDGVYKFDLLPADTIKLKYGRYVYDVGLMSGTNYFNVIPANAFVIKPNVTKWGGAV